MQFYFSPAWHRIRWCRAKKDVWAHCLPLLKSTQQELASLTDGRPYWGTSENCWLTTAPQQVQGTYRTLLRLVHKCPISLSAASFFGHCRGEICIRATWWGWAVAVATYRGVWWTLLCWRSFPLSFNGLLNSRYNEFTFEWALVDFWCPVRAALNTAPSLNSVEDLTMISSQLLYSRLNTGCEFLPALGFSRCCY